MQLLEALMLVDPNDDNSWTSEALPRVEAVEKILGAPVTRAQITAAAPQFTRTYRTLPDPKTGETGPVAPLPAGRITDEEMLVIYDRTIGECTVAIKENTDRRTNAIVEREMLVARMADPTVRNANDADQAGRMAYIRAQNDARMARAERVRGLDLKALRELTKRAPIDEAFARKTGRGTTRPVGYVPPNPDAA